MAQPNESTSTPQPQAKAASTDDPTGGLGSFALISDIHGNMDALQIVLADIKDRGIKRVCCLGDIIGYGPNPCECLDLVMNNCEWALMGNHDFAALYEPTAFNASAEAAAFWTRRQFELEEDPVKRRRRWEFLGSLEIRHQFHGTLCVHASPRRPINEYVFPDDVITSPSKMAQIFDRIEKRCFCGHTHVAGVFTDEPDFYPPADLNGRYRINNGENVSSIPAVSANPVTAIPAPAMPSSAVKPWISFAWNIRFKPSSTKSTKSPNSTNS